jgi:hypothetical protein
MARTKFNYFNHLQVEQAQELRDEMTVKVMAQDDELRMFWATYDEEGDYAGHKFEGLHFWLQDDGGIAEKAFYAREYDRMEAEGLIEEPALC